MKRRYHPSHYRPNGSLRVNGENFGYAGDAKARFLKIEGAEMTRAYGKETGPAGRLARILAAIGPRRTKRAHQDIEAATSRPNMSKTTRRIYDAHCDLECEHHDAELLSYAR